MSKLLSYLLLAMAIFSPFASAGPGNPEPLWEVFWDTSGKEFGMFNDVAFPYSPSLQEWAAQRLDKMQMIYKDSTNHHSDIWKTPDIALRGDFVRMDIEAPASVGNEMRRQLTNSEISRLYQRSGRAKQAAALAERLISGNYPHPPAISYVGGYPLSLPMKLFDPKDSTTQGGELKRWLQRRALINEARWWRALDDYLNRQIAKQLAQLRAIDQGLVVAPLFMVYTTHEPNDLSQHIKWAENSGMRVLSIQRIAKADFPTPSRLWLAALRSPSGYLWNWLQPTSCDLLLADRGRVSIEQQRSDWLTRLANPTATKE
jgi:hypothetical protein